MDNMNKMSESPKIISIMNRNNTSPKVSINTPPLRLKSDSSEFKPVSSRPSTPLRDVTQLRASSPLREPVRNLTPRPSSPLREPVRNLTPRPSSGLRDSVMNLTSKPSSPLREPVRNLTPISPKQKSPKTPEEKDEEIDILNKVINFFLKPVEVINPVNVNPSFDRKTAHKVIDGVKYSSLKELKQNKLKCFFETCEISWRDAPWVDR